MRILIIIDSIVDFGDKASKPDKLNKLHRYNTNLSLEWPCGSPDFNNAHRKPILIPLVGRFIKGSDQVGSTYVSHKLEVSCKRDSAWDVEQDDPLCTLQEFFVNVKPTFGFNIKVVFDEANNRLIIFSTFQLNAAYTHSDIVEQLSYGFEENNNEVKKVLAGIEV
ncbi:hypothetical protein VNO77_26792 [Canavalia gladiata]|uniref:Uncharacterized protein n=1 Tax=Canavalia gladiata TaxID=3824 RepID=A0AAN9KTN9_CANGL